MSVRVREIKGPRPKNRGRKQRPAASLVRLSTRGAGYVLLLTGRYPPFGPGGDHTIDVTFDESDTQNRLWGIPFVGIWAADRPAWSPPGSG